MKYLDGDSKGTNTANKLPNELANLGGIVREYTLLRALKDRMLWRALITHILKENST